MDQPTRNKLRNVVTQCRKLLEEAVAQVLQGQFGVFAGKKGEVQVEPEARMSHLSDEDRAYRRDLLDHFEHINAHGSKPKDAHAQLIREIAFTHLNRLCAYRMMESRGLIRESVSKGIKSQGFLFYLADHEEDERRYNKGEQDLAYRHFLNWLGGTLSEEIGVLFSPTDPANRLYPPQRVIDEVLDLLNSDELAGIWSEDEAIGWVYQYFTPKNLREKARKESPAPRNSYELAFRNQFFTPRYVVEFLTDNTLGRIWYEMRKGDTALKDQCRYMVRRPKEIFLDEGQEPSEPPQSQDDLSQEELLKQPVHIPHRPKKDPRELKILDPACGSGHFLLYCFDLLLTIYEEAWDDLDLGPALQQDYATLDDLRRDVPRLILAHNLHGIDIDLRATQIAALALWLRAQRQLILVRGPFKFDSPRSEDREQRVIRRSNIVCAEPMPGEEFLLNEFLDGMNDETVRGILSRAKALPRDVHPEIYENVTYDLKRWVWCLWRLMKHAADAGSLLARDFQLLSSEKHLEDVVRGELDEIWGSIFELQYVAFFGSPEEGAVKKIVDVVFEFLKTYITTCFPASTYTRVLFRDDVIRCIGFLQVCSDTYDITLMNPPFGEGSRRYKVELSGKFPKTKNDVYGAFVELGLGWLPPRGLLGAITSRTGFFLSSFQKWREEILLKEAWPTVFADLGYGVLDTAMVETAAYCLSKGRGKGETTFIHLLHADENAAALQQELAEPAALTFRVDPSSFGQVPGSPFVYWVSDRVRRLFTELPPFESDECHTRCGMGTLDDFRFLRCWWEVPARTLGRENRWVFFAKGGVSSPFYSPIPLVVLYERNGQELSAAQSITRVINSVALCSSRRGVQNRSRCSCSGENPPSPCDRVHNGA